MKKVLSGILCLGMLFTLIMPASAATDSATVQQTVVALGIMTGDQNGNMNLSQPVTRAEFVKMLVTASVYKDTMQEGSLSSSFKDVKYNHWASDYIKTAVDAGWVVGYVDGSFRPDSTVTFEEAASSVLKLLGYGAEDLSGTYPSAQISKFTALKLGTDLNLTQGQALTRHDCMYIFYNLMGAATKEGQVYGATLGYTINSSGEVDYSALILNDVDGPYVVTSAGISSLVPFDTGSATVYRNGSLSSLSSVSTYDVIYYHENTKIIWIYSDRILGTYTAASPNLIAPESVTVGGNTYPVTTSTAKHKLSSLGDFAIGDTVALLLGMDGDVVDVISATSVDETYYGVIRDISVSTYGTTSSTSKAEYTLSVATTDGVIRQYAVDSDDYKVGNVVSVSYGGGSTSVTRITRSSSLSGSVNSSATTLGSYSFASDVQILDVNSDGDYQVIHPSRLAGATLRNDNVKYFTLNGAGEIHRLILNDITGDLYSYGYMNKYSSSDAGYTFSYYLNGSNGTFTTGKAGVITSSTGVKFVYKNGQISDLEKLSSVSITSLSTISAGGGNQTFPVSEDVQVYLRSENNNYTLISLSAVNTDNYTLTGYYDTSYSAGGHIRVIIAVAK